MIILLHCQLSVQSITEVQFSIIDLKPLRGVLCWWKRAVIRVLNSSSAIVGSDGAIQYTATWFSAVIKIK